MPERNVALPFASSLCGSCTDVCPVKIDLHHQLLAWRRELEAGLTPAGKRRGVQVATFAVQRPGLYRLAGRMVRFFGRLRPRACQDVRRLGAEAGPPRPGAELPVRPRRGGSRAGD